MPRASSWTISSAIDGGDDRPGTPARKSSCETDLVDDERHDHGGDDDDAELHLDRAAAGWSGLRTGRSPQLSAVDRGPIAGRRPAGVVRLGLAERVADAVDRADHVVAELAAQRPDVRVDGPGARPVAVAPHLGEQLLPGEHASGPVEQADEEVELGGREVHRRRRRDAPGGRRGRSRCRRAWQRGRSVPPARRVDPAQDGLHPRHQLPRAERLGEVVVGADGQADDQVGLVVAGREHQHGDVAVASGCAGTPRGRRGRGASGRAPRGRAASSSHERHAGRPVGGDLDVVALAAQPGRHRRRRSRPRPRPPGSSHEDRACHGATICAGSGAIMSELPCATGRHRFVLEHLSTSKAWPSSSRSSTPTSTRVGVLDEFARFMADVWAPTNRSVTRGSTLDGDTVSTPPGSADAYGRLRRSRLGRRPRSTRPTAVAGSRGSSASPCRRC